jgi:hypothetical protein
MVSMRLMQTPLRGDYTCVEAVLKKVLLQRARAGKRPVQNLGS